MAKFITGKDLETAIYDIIWKAEDTLLIVSPFIKLDKYFKDLFLKHLNNSNIHILILFGKNESNIGKSLSKDDFEFFKQFINITVVYIPTLHAKYYGNEKCGVITSINLYDFSFKHNIEFGVYSETSFFDSVKNNSDQDAWRSCIDLAEESEVVFVKRAVYEKNMLSALFGKKYIKSDILLDNTDYFYNGSNNNKKNKVVKYLKDFPDEIIMGSNNTPRPTREESEKNTIPTETSTQYTRLMGYCIRTGEEIPFSFEKPLSYAAYKKWSAFSNPDYPEKYCHFTGELSNGKTCVNNPVLEKNIEKAKEARRLNAANNSIYK